MKFKFDRKVNYYETDGMQIVHHSNYIRYMEEARIYLMEKMGLPYEKLEEAGIAIPTTEVNCKYKFPAKFADILEIEVYINEYTSVRMTVSYVIRNKTQDNKLVLTGETKHCFTNKEVKPISLKKYNEEMNEKFLKVLEEEEKI